MKKLAKIALGALMMAGAATATTIATTAPAEARVSVGIGIGGFGYPGYGYYGGYPYGYGYGYGYAPAYYDPYYYGGYYGPRYYRGYYGRPYYRGYYGGVARRLSRPLWLSRRLRPSLALSFAGTENGSGSSGAVFLWPVRTNHRRVFREPLHNKNLICSDRVQPPLFNLASTRIPARQKKSGAKRMKTSIKAALVAFGALGALAVPASAQPYDNEAYGPAKTRIPITTRATIPMRRTMRRMTMAIAIPAMAARTITTTCRITMATSTMTAAGTTVPSIIATSADAGSSGSAAAGTMATIAAATSARRWAAAITPIAAASVVAAMWAAATMAAAALAAAAIMAATATMAAAA
ncbi:MAG: hypothetical protein U1E93_11940 [Alphaproteobacteria bacterium]